MWPFSRRAAPVYRLPQGIRIYAVGDIHGKADVLRELQAHIARDAQDFEGNKVLEIYLGDYIDRGEQSCDVLDLLLASPPSGHERICLRGNHEQVLLDALEETQALRRWLQFGGLSTLLSYGVALPEFVSGDAAEQMREQLREALPEAHLAFLRSLPLHYECGDYYFVHAGVRPGCSLGAQSMEDKLWIRDDFLHHTKPFARFVVHGHSPNDQPELLAYRANLDISDAPKASLCALRIEGEQRELMVQVKGD